MKAATGELNLTVITLLAVGAVIAFLIFQHIMVTIHHSIKIDFINNKGEHNL